MNVLQKINKRAKQLRQANKNMSHRAAIKKASAEYRGGKLGKVAKKTVKQYGTSNRKRDQERAARPPGPRKSKTGKKYFERRKNRSDVKGKLTGARVTSQIQAELDQIGIADAMIEGYRAIKKAGLTSSQKAQIDRDKKYWLKVKQAHKKNLSNLKTLI